MSNEAPTKTEFLSRRGFFLKAAGIFAATGAIVAVGTQNAEARPKWGNPPGWSRGRKRGWGWG